MTPYDANDDAVSRNPETVNRDTSAVPSREEAEAAVEVLLRWAGDDPKREGLIGTPGRLSLIHI